MIQKRRSVANILWVKTSLPEKAILEINVLDPIVGLDRPSAVRKSICGRI